VVHSTNFRVAANQGRLFAPSTQDYNPWHLSGVLAKLFGFKSAIAQGYWSFSKSLATIGDRLPRYPLHLEVEWQKPIFMPSEVQLLEFGEGDVIDFELWSANKKFRHLQAKARHIPDMNLKVTESA